MNKLSINKYNTFFYLIPIFFILINFYVKFKFISYQSIAGDEPFSIYFSQFNITTIISHLSSGNNPPLFEIILHLWIKLFGISETSVRLLPCLFSSITVYFIYKIGQKFFSFKSAIIASLFFTLSNYQMYFAHEARVYSLFLLLTSVSMYSFLNLTKEPKSKKYSVLLIASSILMLYSHFLSFFVLFVQLLATISISDLRKTFLKRLLICFGVVFFLYLPYLRTFIERFYFSSKEGTWIEPVKNLGQLHDFFNNLINQNTTNYLVFLIIIWFLLQNFINRQFSKKYLKYAMIVSSIFYLFYSISIMGPMPYYWKFSSNLIPMTSYICFILTLLLYSVLYKGINHYYKILLIWFFTPLLIMFISSIWVPMFINRHLIFITPPFFLLIAIGVGNLEKTINLKVSLLIIAIMGISFNRNVDNKREIRGMVNKTKDIKTNRTIVYLCPDYFDLNFSYYYNIEYFKNIHDINLKENLRQNLASEFIFPINSFSAIDTNDFHIADKIIFIDAAADFSYPNNNIYSGLTSRFVDYNVYEFPESYKIYEFRIPEKPVQDKK